VVSLRLSEEGRRLLRERANVLGISQSAVIEVLLRAVVSKKYGSLQVLAAFFSA